MNPLAALAIAAGVAIIYCGLVLWGSSRREAARARHVDALMADAVADVRQVQLEVMRAKFDQIIAGTDWADQ